MFHRWGGLQALRERSNPRGASISPRAPRARSDCRSLRLFQGPRYFVPRVSMGSGRIKAQSRRSPSFILPHLQISRRHLESSMVSCKPGRSCKVDLLLPGVMDIPSVPIGDIEYPEQQALPAAYTYCKCLAWTVDYGSDSSYFGERSRTPKRLCVSQAPPSSWKLTRTFPDVSPLLVASATSGVPKFVEEWPETLDGWRAFGFSV